MAGKFRRGLSIVDDSVDVFRDNPRLALLPLLSLLSIGSVFTLVLGVALHYGVLEDAITNDLLRYAGVFVVLAVSSSVGTFFNAAVVHCASCYFDDEPVSVSDGLAAAWGAKRKIALWSVTAATLGTVLYIIDEKFGVFGSLARVIFDLAWGLLTFFVIPVIVLEETHGVRSVLEKSGDAFRETWGESVTATLGISAAFFPLVVGGMAALGWAYLFASGTTADVVGAIGFVVLVASLVAAQVIGMVARTALYRYARTEERVGPFTERNPNAVFPSK